MESVSRVRRTEPYQLIIEVATLIGAVGGSAAIVGWISARASGPLRFLSDAPWYWYLLVGSVALLGTARWLDRRQRAIGLTTAAASVVTPPAPPPPPPKPSVQTVGAATQSATPMFKAVGQVSSPTTPAREKGSLLVVALRKELATGLSMSDRMPRGDVDGLAAARAIAQGEDPPPDSKDVEAWEKRVEKTLRDAGQASLADYFLGTYSRGLEAIAAAISQDRSLQLAGQLTGRCRLLAEAIKALQRS